MNCPNCPRHIKNQLEVSALLSPEHQASLQLALCDDREGGSCPGDPWQDAKLTKQKERGMEKTEQLPAGGCSNCGAYGGEPQHVLRKRLVWDGSGWVCRECAENGE